MAVLALDVDGVLLDPDRGGRGHWSTELPDRFGISPDDLQSAFFTPFWADAVVGRRPIEDSLRTALDSLGHDLDVESLLQCWFEADYVPVPRAFDLARRVGEAGHDIVLATNQEHRRAEYLRARLGAEIAVRHVFYSAELGHQKSDSQFFELVSQHLGLRGKRSNIVFVDDTLANVTVARSAGWNALLADSDGTWIGDVETALGLSPT